MNIPPNILKITAHGFTPKPVIITDGAWKGEKGWIIGAKNQVDANPIVLESGISLVWFDSEIEIIKN